MRECAQELAELEVQASLLDAMGSGEEAVVVLHVGGVSGGREAAFDEYGAASSASALGPGPGS